MYAVLHPSNFFAQAAARQRPELRKEPFVVVDGESPIEMVFAANKAARSLGVEIGMTRLQAEAFSEVIALRRTVEYEHTAQVALHQVACKFSPRIESVEERPGTYALDIRGMDLLYKDARQLANKLRQSVMAQGFLANIAVAENFHAAVSLACGRTGVSVVPRGCEAQVIGQLPLAALHLAPEHEATFRAWGAFATLYTKPSSRPIPWVFFRLKVARKCPPYRARNQSALPTFPCRLPSFDRAR